MFEEESPFFGSGDSRPLLPATEHLEAFDIAAYPSLRGSADESWEFGIRRGCLP
jgi:hypothetical protein